MATPCNKFCECGRTATVIVSGNHVICERCHDIEARMGADQSQRAAGRRPVRGVYGEPVHVHYFHVAQSAH